MRKLFITLSLILSLAVAVTPNRSEAIVGGLIANPTVSWTGLGMALGAYGTIQILIHSDADEWTIINFGIIAAFVMMAGVLVLDEDAKSVTFEAISDEQAENLGLNLNEVDVYNSELDELNIMFNEVSAEAKSAEEAKDMWISNRDDLSPETFNVLKKLTSK